MRWCRLYGDMVDDPKIGTLSDGQFRTWIELLCLATKAEDEGDTGMTPGEASWALRRNVTETLQELIDRSLVHYSETGTLVITKWANRQSKSDSSTDRVRKHREKKQEKQGGNKDETDETLQGCSSNAPEQSRAEQSRGTDSGEPSPGSPPSPEPAKKAAPLNDEDVFIYLPTKRVQTHSEYYPVPIAHVQQWESDYPGLNVRQELIKARNWLDTRPPGEKKTYRGMNKFVVNWLNRAFDRPQTGGQSGPSSPEPRNRASQREL